MEDVAVLLVVLSCVIGFAAMWTFCCYGAAVVIAKSIGATDEEIIDAIRKTSDHNLVF